jgi:hypothetical protein
MPRKGASPARIDSGLAGSPGHDAPPGHDALPAGSATRAALSDMTRDRSADDIHEEGFAPLRMENFVRPGEPVRMLAVLQQARALRAEVVTRRLPRLLRNCAELGCVRGAQSHAPASSRSPPANRRPQEPPAGRGRHTRQAWGAEVGPVRLNAAQASRAAALSPGVVFAGFSSRARALNSFAPPAFVRWR